MVSISKKSWGNQVPGINSTWSGVTPIAFILRLSTARYVKLAQPGQASPAGSDQHGQVKSTQPGHFSPARSDQHRQVRSTQSGQVSPARSEQSSPVQIPPFFFFLFFSISVASGNISSLWPNRGSVHFFPRSVQVSRCQGYLVGTLSPVSHKGLHKG